MLPGWLVSLPEVSRLSWKQLPSVLELGVWPEISAMSALPLLPRYPSWVKVLLAISLP